MSKRKHSARDELRPRVIRIIGKPREHFNVDGSEKKDYISHKRAKMVADRMIAAGEGDLEVYLCPFCRKWHIGHCKLPEKEEEHRHLLQVFKTEMKILNQMRNELRQLEETVTRYNHKIEELETDIQVNYYQLKNKPS